MVVTVRTTVGKGTLINPTFRAYSYEREIKCFRVAKLGNLLYLYSAGGYVICVVDPADVIKMED